MGGGPGRPGGRNFANGSDPLSGKVERLEAPADEPGGLLLCVVAEPRRADMA